MLIAIAADSASNQIAVVIFSIVMMVIGAPLAANYKSVTTRLTVDAVERAIRMRASLHLNNQDEFRQKWTKRQVLFGRIFGAILTCFSIIFLLLTFFAPE